MSLAGMIARVGAGVTLMAVLLLCASVVAGQVAPYAGEMAFVSDRDGNEEIYLLDLHRGMVHNFTRSPAGEHHPRWSPDGSRLAFISDRDGHWNIYVADARGENLHRLTDNTAHFRHPIWSPDGRFLAFSSGRRDTGRVISAIHVADLERDVIYSLPPAGARLVYAPVWSADSRRVLVHAHVGGEVRAFHMRFDATDVQPGTGAEDVDWWVGVQPGRPDGVSVVTFVSRAGVDLCLTDSIHRHRRCVSNGRGTNVEPAWRP